MISIPPGLLGSDLDFGTVRVTADSIAAYAEAVGDRATLSKPIELAPPTFCLSLHRGMRPEIELPPDHFGVYGGHDIEFRQPLRPDRTYHLHARLTDVYEKSGRSGALTVIAREARIEEAAGHLAVQITERQIVRRIGSREPTVESQEPTTAPGDPTIGPPNDSTTQAPNDPTTGALDDPTIGEDLEPLQRQGPSPAQISAYAGAIGAREGIFTHPNRARDLGFGGLVVPGPMLSAFVEQFLRGNLPDWRIERLGVTFRVPTITGTPLTIHGVVTERHEMADGVRVICDVVIEHAEGERAVAGTATLRRTVD